MATTTRLEELLGCVPLLADLPEDLLRHLAARAELQSFQQGQPICRTDQPPERLYLLVEGTVRAVVFSSRLPRGWPPCSGCSPDRCWAGAW